MEKEFAVTIAEATCINCGICMDLCPIRALDMTRTSHEGPESTFARGDADPESFNWMMETPVQVDHCNGCTICVRECPTEAITIHAVGERPVVALRQGPILVEPHGGEVRWMPLSSYTRAAMKVQAPREAHDPWGKDLRWRLAKRAGPWQVWRTWVRK
jgi:ferredoxin